MESLEKILRQNSARKDFQLQNHLTEVLGFQVFRIELVRFHKLVICLMKSSIIPSSETGLDYGDVNPGENPGVITGVNLCCVLLTISLILFPDRNMNKIMYAGHSDREWTIWTKCKEGKQNRERVNRKLGKDFETRFCLKGKPFQILPPEPRVDVGGGFDVDGGGGGGSEGSKGGQDYSFQLPVRSMMTH